MLSMIIYGILLLGATLLLFGNNWGFFFIGMGLIGVVITLKEVPADPPHLGVVTLFGERRPKIKKEGWRFLFRYFPFWYDVILVNVQKKNQDLTKGNAISVMTPDLANLEIPISLTWTPGTPEKNDKRNGQFLINYLNSEGEKGVRNILDEVVRERVREWAIAVEEGPQTFREALRAHEEAMEILIKTVAGEEMKRVPSSIPTPILLKYFNNPQKVPTPSERKKWGSNWEKVDEEMKKLSENEVNEIREVIEERRKTVKKIKSGNGVQPIASLGITLNRLNIGDIKIKPDTQLEKDAEKEVSERRQQEAEKVELNHVEKRIKKFVKAGYSLKEARDIVQTERSKVDKKVIEIVDLEEIGRGMGQGIVSAFGPRAREGGNENG